MSCRVSFLMYPMPLVSFEQKPISPEMMETIARICVVMNRDFQVWCCGNELGGFLLLVSRVVCSLRAVKNEWCGGSAGPWRVRERIDPMLRKFG